MLPPWPLWRALKDRGLPALLLIWHASEGDNTGDALVLATAAAQALEAMHGKGLLRRDEGVSGEGRLGAGNERMNWKAPRSWGAALYGSQRVTY